MTHNIDLGEKEITEKPNKKAKGAQYRAAVTPLMNEVYKDFADAPKSQAFVKNLDETEADLGLLSKKVDVLKKIQESHSERISVTSISKLSKLMDKLIIATLKNEPLDTDSDLVLSTVKKELQALKSEVTKLKKTNSSESRTFKF